MKRRIPPDANLANLGLNKEVYENLYQCYQHAQKVMKTLQDIVKNSVQVLATSGGLSYMLLSSIRNSINLGLNFTL